MRIQERMKVELSLEAMNKEMQRSVDKELQMTREHEKQRKSDQEKIQQLELVVVERIEAFKRASKEHEREKDEMKKSLAEKEQKLWDLEGRLCIQKREHEKEVKELKKSAEERDQKISEMEAQICLQKREHEASLARCTQECEVLQNKSKKLEKDKEDLKLFVSEKEKSLNTQRSHHEKLTQETMKKIEKQANTLLEARLCQQKIEDEKLRQADAKKVQELQMSLACSKQECEALQNKSVKLEMDREDLKLSITEREQSLIIQRGLHEKRIQEKNKEIEKQEKSVKGLEARLCVQKSEQEQLRESYEKKVQALQMSLVHLTKEYKTVQEKSRKLEQDKDDFIQFIAEKEQSFWNQRTQFLEAKLNESEKKVQEVQMALACSKQECEALQNKSKKLEKEKEDLNLSIAEKEQSLNTQRLEHEKQVQEKNEEIEKRANIAKFWEARLCAQKRAHKKLRDADEKKIEELSTEMKRTKAATLSNEQEKVEKLSIHHLHEIEALKEENVNLKKELEKNESALNEGFQENKVLTARNHVLKSKFSRMQNNLAASDL